MSMPSRGPAKAVALKYWPGLPAPFLLAKAEGRHVERFVSIARDAGVPVLKEEGLSEALFPLEVGDYVPAAYFEIVARVFAFVKRVEET